MRSQADQILDYLAAGHSLTPLEALEKFGCFRLAARVNDLRKHHTIVTDMAETPSGKQVARYRLLRDAGM